MAERDRDERLAELFELVVDLPPEERTELLDRRCPDDPALRAELEELVRADRGESRGPLGGTAHRPAPPEEQRVGHFRLLELLGEGGMGVVYLAEQEAPVRRRVALKMIRFGLQTEEIAIRFERERQALARMNHPGIAEIYESGTSESGRPYFAMEYVAGPPITTHCDSARLPLEARLRLFCQVCDAMQHAHQKGVLHRDLKPTNVLVTHADGEPRSKIIDFGVAQALFGSLAGEEYHTTVGRVVGTYLYMSPEQAGGAADVDTRSDVYSLGVLLHELLVGVATLPDDVLQRGDPVSLQRAVLEDDPCPPSQRVTQLGPRAPAIAAARRETEASLARHLRGDLDWIVGKTIEKDRARRYASASELRADVERHLENLPVLAGPPSTVYRMGRFVRRHRVLVASSSLAALSLVVALVATAQALSSSRAALVAERARNREVELRAEVTQARTEFLEHALFDSPPGSEPAAALEQLLDYAALDIHSLYGDRSEIEAAVRYGMGRSYLTLGAPNKAREQLLRAYAIQSQQPAASDLDLFLTLEGLIQATRRVEGIEAAAPYVEHSLALAQQLAEEDPELRTALAALRSEGSTDPAALGALLGHVAALVPRDGEGPGRSLFLSRALIEAGLASLAAGEIEAAEAAFDRIEEAARAALDPGRPAHLLFLRSHADAYLRLTPPLPRRALALARELRETADTSLPAGHWMHAEARRIEGLALAELGPAEFPEAEAVLLEAEARATPPAEAARALPELVALLLERGTLDDFLAGSFDRWRAGPRAEPWWPAAREDVPEGGRARALHLLSDRAGEGDPLAATELARLRAMGDD